MLSRAFTRPKRSPNKLGGDQVVTGSESILHEYEDCLVGFMEDLPLHVIGEKSFPPSLSWNANSKPTLREVLRASVGMMGESGQGITEKVVFLDRKVCALKRFRAVGLRRGEYRRRIERLAQISSGCEYLVPVRAYLYTKRIKFVLCDYYPMGSLANLLSGAREFGHTTLDWTQRLKIMITSARAILFVHSQSPLQEKKLLMNVHGNIKSSNIMVNVDFSACLSEYGFVHLAEQVEQACDMGQSTTPCHDMSQPWDIYNFGLVMLDILAGPKAKDRTLIEFARQKKDEIKDGKAEFFEFPVDEKGMNQALDVLEIALVCLNKAEGSRPCIKKILQSLVEVSGLVKVN